MQGWYNQDGQLISIDDCLECWKDAARVKNGIYNPTEAFWWGNPAKGSPMEMYIDGTYEGDDWIAGIPYISYIDISAYGGDYNYFLVVTWNQNNACGAVNCMGFKD